MNYPYGSLDLSGSRSLFFWIKGIIRMEVMIDRDQSHDLSGLKSLMIRNEVMIYPYGSLDLSGSRSFFFRI
jgi:hypothetical protein